MPFFILIVGAVLVVAAFNNTHGALGANLTRDLAGFFPWSTAIGIILSLGLIPGFKIPARMLLALVLVVVVLKNYGAIISGFSDFTKTGAAATGEGTPAPVPTSAFSDNPNTSTLPTPQQISGSAANTVPSTPDLILTGIERNPLNPFSYVAAIEAGFGSGRLLGI